MPCMKRRIRNVAAREVQIERVFVCEDGVIWVWIACQCSPVLCCWDLFRDARHDLIWNNNRWSWEVVSSSVLYKFMLEQISDLVVIDHAGVFLIALQFTAGSLQVPILCSSVLWRTGSRQALPHCCLSTQEPDCSKGNTITKPGSWQRGTSALMLGRHLEIPLIPSQAWGALGTGRAHAGLLCCP